VKQAAAVGSLSAIAAGGVLTLALRSSAPGLAVMLGGMLGFAAVLIRFVGAAERREQPRRARAVPRRDPDLAYFDALREAPFTATARNPAPARPSADDGES
jgi:hypothetical protein